MRNHPHSSLGTTERRIFAREEPPRKPNHNRARALTVSVLSIIANIGSAAFMYLSFWGSFSGGVLLVSAISLFSATLIYLIVTLKDDL